MKKFWIGIYSAFVLVAASYIGNLWYFQVNQLGEPVFLNHHIELTTIPGDSFNLFYLEDLHAENPVSSVYFPDYPGMKIVAHHPDYAGYSHQHLGRFILSLPDSFNAGANDRGDEPPIIRSVVVQYRDGMTKEMNIGEIRLIKLSPDEGDWPINGFSGGSSSNLTGYDTFGIDRPVVFQSIKTNYLSLIETGQLQVYMDSSNSHGKTFQMEGDGDQDSTTIPLIGVPFDELKWPQNLSKGDSIRISYKYVPKESAFADVYHINLQLELKENDHIWTNPISILLPPSLTEAEVRSLVKKRRDQQ